MPLLVNVDRRQIIESLPNNNVVAEIGVFRGAFALNIFRRCKPGRLHLIDPWGLSPDDEYVKEYRVADDMEELFKGVQRMFETELAAGRIEIHRQYSHNVATEFTDDYFDWIYIDGMHSYPAVYRDLTTYQSKVKRNGFILGHDFSNTRRGRIKKFGVIRAVTQFCKEYGYTILAITNEDAPTYVLTVDPYGSSSREFITRLLDVKGISVIDLDMSLLSSLDQVELVYAGGKRRQLLRFGRRS